MSSDFSISSPRKSRIGDRSLTYDEDFENFLNDETSESEFSSNKLKKQTKPWWMNDEDDRPGKTSTSFNSTKSFVKKPKPEIPKLQPTFESNENDDNDDDDKPLETNRYSEDFDEENSKKSSLSIKSRKSLEKNESQIQQSIHEFDEESSEQITSSHKSLPSVVQRKTNEKPLEATTPNLLSKVMFIDSLESGALGTQTLKQLKQETLRKNESLNEQNQTSKLNTQTRRDLADLEIVYRNLTTHTDSGLNTMIRATSASSEIRVSQEENEHEASEIQDDHYEDDNNSQLGLQAIKVIKEELEQRVLKQVLDEFNTKSENNVKDSNLNWPPSKYRHVKGTGYGTTWKSKPIRNDISKGLVNNSTVTLNTKPKYTSSSNYNLKSFDNSIRNDNFESNYEKNNQIIKNLQNQLIKCVDDNEKKVKDIRVEYEKQLNDLRAKLNDVTNQLNEKFNENFKKRVTFEEDEHSNEEQSKQIKSLEEKIALLEQSLSEQESLMKGYQIENERLYTEMKKLKENTQKQVSKLEEEKNQLKLDLIQEKLQVEKDLNKKSQDIHVEKSLDKISKKILPIKEETCLDTEKDMKLKELSRENLELKQNIDFYEKNQQQIELDAKIIDEKNKEIKKLNDRLLKIEMNKTSPDFIREISRLKKQLHEMNMVVKRLRDTKKNDKSPINLSIEYYEKRIEDLENKLKDKSLDMERHNRMWNKKLYLYKKLRDQESGLVSARDRSLSPILKKMDEENLSKIKYLEKENENLRNLLKNYDKRSSEKQKESEILTNKNIIEKKIYEPEIFTLKSSNSERFIDENNFEEVKKLYSEIETIKIKLLKTENEARLNAKDYEFKIEQLKNLSTKRIEDLNNKHKNELEKLICAFTGSKIVLGDSDSNGIFDDPIKFRLLIQACNRNSENDEKINRLVKMNRALNRKCAYLENVYGKISDGSQVDMITQNSDVNSLVNYYESQIEIKNEEIEKFKNELDNMLKILHTLNV